MTSVVARASSGSSYGGQVSPLVLVQDKGSRNKRKFRADPPLNDPDKSALSPQNECSDYEFSAEKFEAATCHGSSSACDLCGVNQYHSDGLKLDLGLSSAISSSEGVSSHHTEGLEAEALDDVDWSDLTESQLEELVLCNLDAIFKSAIKKIVSCGYTEEVATKAVLRSGLCYGCKDTVSNIVDNTLQLLRNGQEIDPSREHCFEDIQQLEKYVLAEMVCVLREVRPFFSTGDAMWCLLICDMNVSHACAMDGDLLNSFAGDEASNRTCPISTQPLSKSEAKCTELNLTKSSKSIASSSCSRSSQPEAPTNMSRVSNMVRPKNSAVLNGLVSEKEGSSSAFDSLDKSFSSGGSSEASMSEEKFVVSRKVHSGNSKREFILRQKSLHLDKNHRAYGSKGASRAAKLKGLGGLILDKKLKSVSDSAGVNIKSGPLRLTNATGIDIPRDNGSQNPPNNPGLSSPESFYAETPTVASSFPITNNPSTPSPISVLPAFPAGNPPPALSASDTELSLSLPTKSIPSSAPVCCMAEAPKTCYPGVQYEKSLGQWVHWDKKDEMLMKLLPRTQLLQIRLQDWTEWANQKVMQAARRLNEDKAELKSLRQEKEEVERLKKEKQALEDSTMKKLAEMENALCKASGQVEKANSTVRRLEVENTALRQEMEAARLRAAESAASCQEVSKREKKTLMKFQSWEKQKMLLQEELLNERRAVAQLLQNVEQARQQQEQQEARWKQEEKSKEELLFQASSLREEREQVEASAKSKDAMFKLKAETNLQKYKNDIQKLEKEISQLRLKADSSKIAALRWGIDGSYASRLTEVKNYPTQESWMPSIADQVKDLHDYSETDGLKRERECVMCLSEEMSVVFLPCAHQVVCTTCNDLHERQGMKDCPSCRSPIQQRIPVRYAHS